MAHDAMTDDAMTRFLLVAMMELRVQRVVVTTEMIERSSPKYARVALCQAQSAVLAPRSCGVLPQHVGHHHDGCFNNNAQG